MSYNKYSPISPSPNGAKTMFMETECPKGEGELHRKDRKVQKTHFDR